jgi:hypothetical protein
MALATPFTRMATALAASWRRLLAGYRSLDAQIWHIAKNDRPGAPKPPGQPPKMRCC